jgi:hypothetical protein
MPESEPRLIRGYLQVLAAQLPGPIVEELTDGLTALAIAVSSARIALCARAAVASQQNT